jgi:endonuclease YncB( thermonuclease family)
MTIAPRVSLADPPPQHVWTWPARLVRPVDGDSFWVVTDRGYADSSEREVRLAGVNCPEHGTKDGDAASAFTAAWLAEAEKRATTPWPLLMRSYKARELEKFGRCLVVVWRQGDPVSLNQALLVAEHAVPYDP